MVFGGEHGLKAHVEGAPAPCCHFLPIGAQDIPSVLKMRYGKKKPLLSLFLRLGERLCLGQAFGLGRQQAYGKLSLWVLG